jgi:FKBP-type peptidyl-prolyl cis-trans isomerase
MMSMIRRLTVLLLVCVALTGCRLKDEDGIREDGTIAAPEDVAAPPADALRTESGIASKVLRVGVGPVHPTAQSRVTVHYTGWTTDGEMFDSSVARGAPIEFSLDGVIPGWTEGVQLMVVGEKRRFWIPGNLAYDNPDINMPGAPKGMLVFDIELLNVR